MNDQLQLKQEADELFLTTVKRKPPQKEKNGKYRKVFHPFWEWFTRNWVREQVQGRYNPKTGQYEKLETGIHSDPYYAELAKRYGQARVAAQLYLNHKERVRWAGAQRGTLTRTVTAARSGKHKPIRPFVLFYARPRYPSKAKAVDVVAQQKAKERLLKAGMPAAAIQMELLEEDKAA